MKRTLSEEQKLKMKLGREKKKCVTCKKPKEVEVKLPLFTEEELIKVYELSKKYKPTPEEINYMVNFNNRALNDNKLPGCGKCIRQVVKNIQNLYKREMGV